MSKLPVTVHHVCVTPKAAIQPVAVARKNSRWLSSKMFRVGAQWGLC